MPTNLSEQPFVLYIGPADPELDLQPRKVYQVCPDATAHGHGWIRVIDDSGEDYLYPERLFVAVDLPAQAEAAFASAG